MSFFDKLQDRVRQNAERHLQQRGAARIVRQNKADLLPPPRSFSLIGKLSVLLHSTLMYIGLGFFSLGFLITVLMLRLHWAYEAINASGTWVTVSATITDFEKQRSSGKNSSTTYYYTYTYTAGTQTLSNKQGIATDLNKSVGDTLTVDYLDTQPSKSYIHGQHPSSMIIGAIIGAPFLLIGCALLYFGLRRTRRNLYLYQYGQFAKGTLLSSEMTNEKINKQNVWKYQFTFNTPDGKEHIAETKTHLNYEVEDEEYEFVLYNPDDPKVAIVYDAEEYAPRVQDDGTLRPRIKFVGFFMLILLILCVIGGLFIPAQI